MNYDLVGVTHQDAHQVTTQDSRIASILEFCSVPRTRDELQIFADLTDRGHFRAKILRPLLNSGKLQMTIPDKPNSRNQKYVRAK